MTDGNGGGSALPEPDHLPKRRPGGGPADPNRLPRQRRGITPQLHGRYPDFDVLEQADGWDAETREVVLGRVYEPPALRFFDPAQAECLAALCDTLLDQDREPRIPVLAAIDEKLHAGRRDGYQYAGLPDDGELFRQLPAALDEAARGRGAESFARADDAQRQAIVDDFAHARLHGPFMERYPQHLVWKVVTRYALEAFYAHPWAWNEIGFGGPAYPRGYFRMNIDTSEPWEGHEARHDDPGREFPREGR